MNRKRIDGINKNVANNHGLVIGLLTKIYTEINLTIKLNTLLVKSSDISIKIFKCI